MRPNPPIIRPANHGQCPTPSSPASTPGPRAPVNAMNSDSAFTPLAPLERWISYTQAEIVSIRSDLIQHLQAEIMKLRNDLISYHKQFVDYQKICQSQLDVLTQQVRQSNQSMTEIQSSIVDLQNTQTEFARNIEDVYRKLISLSSQLHGRSPPETQTVPPPNPGGRPDPDKSMSGASASHQYQPQRLHRCQFRSSPIRWRGSSHYPEVRTSA